jgi:hypothetical protein
MKIKIYLILFLSHIFLNFGFAKLPTERNPLDGEKSTTPVFITLPTINSAMGNQPTEIYTFDTLSHVWSPLPFRSPLLWDSEKMKALSFDPVRFTITANKETVAIGEEIELTITAEYLDVHGMLMFQFEGANGYTLKMLIPQGFVITGGNYYDFIQGKVDKTNPKLTYTIKGFFEVGLLKPCFRLLKSNLNTTIGSLYVERFEYCKISFNPEISYINNQVSLNSAKETNRSLKVSAASSPPSVNISLISSTDGTGNINLDAACGKTVYYNVKNCQVKSADINVTNLNQSNNSGFFSSVFTSPGSPVNYTEKNFTNYFNQSFLYNLIPTTQDGLFFVDVSMRAQFTNCCYDETTQKRFFNVKCENGTSLSSNILNISGFNKKPASPDLVFSNNNLTASCPNGSTVRWTNGETSTTRINVSSGTYNAQCVSSSCRSDTSVITVINTCVKPNIPIISPSSPKLETGQISTTLTASICNVGTLSWNTDESSSNIQGKIGNTYKVKCVNGLNCESEWSAPVTVQNCTPPAKPVITPATPIIPSGQTSVTLNSNCSSGTPRWNDGSSSTSASIPGYKNISYKVLCVSNNCESEWSNEVFVQDCLPPEKPSLSANANKVNPGTVTVITASGCDGTIIWVDSLGKELTTGGTANTRMAASASKEVGKGTYYAKCKNSEGCLSLVSSIEIKEFGCDYDVIIGSNATEIGLSRGEKFDLWSNLNTTYYDLNWYRDLVNLGATGPNHSISQVLASDQGTYTLKATLKGTNVTCKSNSIYLSVSPCNTNASLNYALQSNNSFWIGVQFNKPCTNCNIKWYRNGQQIEEGQNQYIIYPNVAANRGNYHINVSTPFGCSFDSPLLNVDFPAQPNYQAMVQNLYCDNIQGYVGDLANPNVVQKARLVFSDLSGSEVKSFEINPIGNGSGTWYYKVPFPDTLKDGNSYKVGVQHINNSYYYSPPTYNSKILSCCNLSIKDLQTGSVCDNADQTTSLSFKFTNRNSALPLNYKIYVKKYLEFGGVAYEAFGDYVAIPVSVLDNSLVTVQGLPTGEYKIELRQGALSQATDCIVNDYFTVDCSVINEGCRAPLISVNPLAGIQEGLGISPILSANFLSLDGVSAKTNTNLVKTAAFDGSSSLKLGEMLGWENFTSEAWVFLGSNSLITVGQIGEGQKNRTLLKSKYSGDKINWELSVGSNGITLIENYPITGQSRVPFSFNGNLKGWHYLALVYENNLPKLFIDGELASVATKTGKQHFGLSQNYQIQGPASLGSDRDNGFKGLVDEVKIFNVIKNATQIKSNSLLRADNSILTQQGIRGYFTFEGTTPFTNLVKTNDIDVKSEGNLFTNTITDNENLDKIYQTSNLDWYYNGELVSSQTSKYQIPLKDIKVGDHTYVIKFKGANDQQCETKKVVTVSAPPINELSGCYFLNSINTIQNPSNASEYYLGTLSGLEIKPKVQKKTGVMDIWEINHLGDQRYLIKSTANVGKNLSSKDNVSLVDNTIFDDTHVWRFTPEGADANMTYSIRPLNQNTKALGYWGSSPSSVFLDNYSAANEKIFRLEKTACPQPPLECSVDSKVNYERWFSNLANSDITYFNSFNVRDYIDQRPLADFSQTIALPKVYVDNNSQGVFQNKPTSWREEKFVSRISGYLCPQQTGSYHIALKTNQWAELYLSTDEDPANKTLKLTRSENEDYFKNSNTVYGIPMVKGRNIYFEIIAKDWDTYHFVGLGMRLSTSGDFNTSDAPITLANIASYPRDFKTRKAKSQSEDCEIPQISFIGSKPLMNLWPKDTVFAGDFNVEIEYARGSSGLFSGYGIAYMKNKFLKNTRVVVKFDGISVNDEYELTNGVFESTYDKTKAGILDVSDELHKFKSFLEVADSIAVATWEKLGDRKKLEYLVKSLKEMAETDLPEELQSEAYDIANRLKNATSKAQFDQAKADLAALNNKKEAFLDWYALVIKNALLKIKADAGTCTAPPGSSGSGTLVANSSWQPSGVSTPTTDPAVLARFTTEVNYNVCVLTKSFSDIYLNSSVSKATLKDLAKELNKGSITLLDELFEIYKGSTSLPPPSASTSPAVAKSVEFLKSNIYKLLSQQVYNESN